MAYLTYQVSMARTDWVYPALQHSLVNEVDKVVERAKDSFGETKYRSRTHFIVEAIKRLLILEGFTNE